MTSILLLEGVWPTGPRNLGILQGGRGGHTPFKVISSSEQKKALGEPKAFGRVVLNQS